MWRMQNGMPFTMYVEQTIPFRKSSIHLFELSLPKSLYVTTNGHSYMPAQANVHIRLGMYTMTKETIQARPPAFMFWCKGQKLPYREMLWMEPIAFIKSKPSFLLVVPSANLYGQLSADLSMGKSGQWAFTLYPTYKNKSWAGKRIHPSSTFAHERPSGLGNIHQCSPLSR